MKSSSSRSFLEGGLTIGQSNAGYVHGEPGGPILKDLQHDGCLLMLSGKAGGSIGVDQPDTFDLSTLISYVEPNGAGQTPAGMLGLAALRFDEGMGFPKEPIALHTSFRGDTGLENLFPDQPFHIHENAIASQRAITEAANVDGVRYDLRWVDFIQGEAGPFNNYSQLLRRYIEEVLPLYAVAADQEQTPHLIISQINSFTTANECNPVVLDLLEVAQERFGRGVTLAGPMYQCPFHDPGHLTDLGRMIHGEIRAIARHYVVRQQAPWNPLWPRSVQRSGALIKVEMDLPPDASLLRWDRDWVCPVPNEGFIYKDATNSAAIVAVEILKSDILIHLNCSPDGGEEVLEYATFNKPNDFSWASGRGLLYAESDLFSSVYFKAGYPVPSIIRHYCVAFRMPIMPSEDKAAADTC